MNQRRSAFTLTQLLILLALMLLFLGFFLASVGRVKFAAGRAGSVNNMKQIGIACHSIYDATGAFPAGIDANGYSAHTHLLPYIEQDAVYKSINLQKAFDDKVNENARKTVIK